MRRSLDVVMDFIAAKSIHRSRPTNAFPIRYHRHDADYIERKIRAGKCMLLRPVVLRPNYASSSSTCLPWMAQLLQQQQYGNKLKFCKFWPKPFATFLHFSSPFECQALAIHNGRLAVRSECVCLCGWVEPVRFSFKPFKWRHPHIVRTNHITRAAVNRMFTPIARAFL